VGAPGDSRGVAEELTREGERGAALSHASRPVEQEGVRGPLAQRGAEEGLGLVLLRKGLEAVHE
jgi:hypothetical protein